MKHPTDELTALLDHALSAARQAEVLAHLVGCAACRAERDRLASTLALLDGLPPPAAPSPSFTPRLAARLAAGPASRDGSAGWLVRWRWRLVAPAAGLAAAMAVAVITVRHQRAEELALATALPLLEEYEAVASLGEVETAEDAAVVASLEELGRRGAP